VPTYDRQYDPPAPVLDLTLTHPVKAGLRSVMRGKLDTAAGLTVIPQQAVRDLTLSRHGEIWTRSYDGALLTKIGLFRPFNYRRARSAGGPMCRS
jgi:hypothetical protein